MINSVLLSAGVFHHCSQYRNHTCLKGSFCSAVSPSGNAKYIRGVSVALALVLDVNVMVHPTHWGYRSKERRTVPAKKMFFLAMKQVYIHPSPVYSFPFSYAFQ
jgi:hypothetical protein